MVATRNSGTTSPERKFVLVGARSFLCNLADFAKEFDLDPADDTIFAASPATFDPFYLDIFMALGWLSCSLLHFLCSENPC